MLGSPRHTQNDVSANTQSSFGLVTLTRRITIPPLQASCVLSLVSGPRRTVVSKVDVVPALSEPPRGVRETDAK